MNRPLIVILFILCPTFCNAQHFYRCTADSVAVRLDAGDESDIFYIATSYYDCPVGYVYLNKGFVFMCKDEERDGYSKIYNNYDKICWDEGWIQSKYMSPAVKCTECRGKGTNRKICKTCNGTGDWTCCQYKGTEVCKKCKGIGYY